MTALILNWFQACEAGVLACGGKGYRLAKLYLTAIHAWRRAG
jgi:hypothetical protein